MDYMCYKAEEEEGNGAGYGSFVGTTCGIGYGVKDAGSAYMMNNTPYALDFDAEGIRCWGSCEPESHSPLSMDVQPTMWTVGTYKRLRRNSPLKYW